MKSTYINFMLQKAPYCNLQVYYPVNFREKDSDDLRPNFHIDHNY